MIKILEIIISILSLNFIKRKSFSCSFKINGFHELSLNLWITFVNHRKSTFQITQVYFKDGEEEYRILFRHETGIQNLFDTSYETCIKTEDNLQVEFPGILEFKNAHSFSEKTKICFATTEKLLTKKISKDELIVLNNFTTYLFGS